jgi:hypothetical protein
MNGPADRRAFRWAGVRSFEFLIRDLYQIQKFRKVGSIDDSTRDP